MTIQTALMASPVGPLLLAADDYALVLCEFASRQAEQLAELGRYFSGSIEMGDNALLQAARAQLAEYFAGRRQVFDLPLHYPGTPFQRQVWQQLLAIPYGQTLSYQALAENLGDAKALRAVGAANGRNRIAIIIPCHRVINKSGQLGGFGGGLPAKRWLLALERGQPGLAF